MKDLDLEDLFLRERQIQSRSALIEHRVDIALNFSSFHLALIENLSNRRKKKKKEKEDEEGFHRGGIIVHASNGRELLAYVGVKFRLATRKDFNVQSVCAKPSRGLSSFSRGYNVTGGRARATATNVIKEKRRNPA